MMLKSDKRKLEKQVEAMSKELDAASQQTMSNDSQVQVYKD